MAALNTLPNELLSLVTSQLDRPKDLVSLALSNRRLNEFAKLDGWKAFLKGRFRLTGLDSDAYNAVHGLTTLYNNWNRKAFVARYIEPDSSSTSLNTWQRSRWGGSTGQTMGYQPSIDSYEETNGTWTDRREVLAWSAGTQIALRIKETGAKAVKAWEDYRKTEAKNEKGYVFDQFRHQNWWFTYKIPQSTDGRDDVTELKLLRPHQRSSTCEHIAFGTASGSLSLLSADPTLKKTDETVYDTGHRAVGSISVSPANEPLMAAILADSSLALYTIVKDTQGEPTSRILSEVTLERASSVSSRIWSCNFVSNNKVAVGLGPSREPIQVYEITPSGLLSEPLRKFSLDPTYRSGTELNDWTLRRSTSVYPVLPLPSDSHGGSETSDLFLSGGYDGIVRLHDMRSPRDFESQFWDVTNSSSVYSLANQGLERFVAGSSMHSMLKVFDLRFPGWHAYRSIPLTDISQSKQSDRNYNTVTYDARTHSTLNSGGWNLFLNPSKSTQQHGNRQLYRHRPREDSPVYSLSIPSSTSPNVYAGLEGTVENLTFLSVTDMHPDPLLSQGITRSPDNNNVDIKMSYNPNDDIMNLGMYEQGSGEKPDMQLVVQDDVWSDLATNRDFARRRGLDTRWKDPAADGEKWLRGRVPQGNVHRGGRGGGGRGRGRGRGRGTRSRG
jgi:hypothetical protein